MNALRRLYARLVAAVLVREADAADRRRKVYGRPAGPYRRS